MHLDVFLEENKISTGINFLLNFIFNFKNISYC